MMRALIAGRRRLPNDSWDLIWNEVWADYDARHGPPAVLLPQAHQAARRGSSQRRDRSVLVLLTALVILLLAASAYAAAPVHAVRGIINAFRSADRTAVAAVVDWAAMEMAPAFAITAWSQPAGAPAEAFLAKLEQTVRLRLATPEGLLALVQARAGSGWPPPELATTGLGTARLTLMGAGQSGRGIALSLALREMLPPRWVVVAAEPLG
jgi:hypothetical protein